MKKIYFLIIIALVGANILHATLDKTDYKKSQKKYQLRSKAEVSRKRVSPNSAIIKSDIVRLKANDIGDVQMKIDSIAYVDYENNLVAYEIYFYNPEGINVEIHYYEYFTDYNAFFQWIQKYQYDKSDNLIEYLEYFVDPDNGQLYEVDKELFKYNDDDQLTAYIDFELNNDVVEETYKLEVFYNDSGVEVENISYLWNSLEEKWKNDIKQTLFYDTSNTFNLVYEYYWNSGWDLVFKNSLEVSSDSVKQWIGSEFESDDSSWTEVTFEKYVFDLNSYLIEYNTGYFDDNNAMVIDYKEIYTNDDEGYFTKQIILEWDDAEDDWIGTKFEVVYDENDPIIYNDVYYWDIETQVWYFTFSQEYHYDDYLNNLVGISKKYDIKLDIYPNPVANYLTIDLPVNKSSDNLEYKIYNSIGNAVKQGILKQHQQINMTNLESGMYFLKVEVDNNNKIIKKILKK